jgi:hypothetical protein
MPFVQENYKPSTLAGYKNLWEAYLSARLDKIVLRDFRTVDAANLLGACLSNAKTGFSRTKNQ